MMKSVVKTGVLLTFLLATAASGQFAEAGIMIVGSGASATYDPFTGVYSGPPGTSNLGPISIAGTVINLPLSPTIIVNNPTPGQIWFQAPFEGEQTLTHHATGDILAGDLAGVVELELISGDPLDPAFNPLPGSSSQGVWAAQFFIDPTTSTGQFAGATGALDVTAFNPPFDWTVAPYVFDWTVDGEIHPAPEPSSFTAFGIAAVGLLFSRRRRKTLGSV